MKIGLAFPDSGLHSIIIPDPSLGNPGIGGTQYEFALLAQKLLEKYPDTEVYMYHYQDNVFPKGVIARRIKDDREAVYTASRDGVDLLLFYSNKKKAWYAYLEEYQVAGVAWAHNYFEEFSIGQYLCVKKSKYVVRIVFVGKEEYEAYVDTDLIQKATYIFDMVCTETIPERIDANTREVTYLGAITKSKGFHVLAKAWKDVVKKVPEATLNVIGSGATYRRRESVLGDYNIASKAYERRFIRYITDGDGRILDSVKLWGNVGEEKTEILSRTRVGVVNPSSSPETFCISAVEMERQGIPVCGRREFGLLDTVVNGKSGLLSKTKRGLADNIVQLLADDSLNMRLGRYAREHAQKFDADVIISQWYDLFCNIINQKEELYRAPQDNFGNDFKWLRVISRFVRFNLRLRFLPPVTELIMYVRKLPALPVKLARMALGACRKQQAQ